MKKQLKLMSLLLSLALLMISAAPLTANAFDSIDADATAQLITPSEDAIYSILGANAPAELCSALTAINILITNNTLIEVVPFSNGISGTALEVTNANGVTISKDVLVKPGNNGSFAEIIPVTDGTFLPMVGYPVDFTSETGLTIHANAVYNVYDDGLGTEYFQPQGLLVICYGDLDNVTDLTVVYSCVGHQCTYPGFQFTSNDMINPEEHDIPIYEEFPVSNTYYHNADDPYPSNMVIYTSSGGVTLGQTINLSVWIGNEPYEGTRKIID